MLAVLDHRGYSCIGGSHHEITGGVNAHALAQNPLGKDLVGNLAQGNHLAGKGSHQQVLLRRGLRLGGGSGFYGGSCVKATVSGGEAAAANGNGQTEGNHDGSGHRNQEAQPVLGLDGENTRQTAHTDGVGLHLEAGGDHCSHRGTDHAAYQRKAVFQVNAEQGGLGHAQIAGDAGGDVYLLGPLVLLLQHRHGQHGGALRNVGKGDHGPQDGALIQIDQLGVDGVGHVVQAGHNDRRVNQAEHRGEQPFYLRGQAHVNHCGNGVTDLPADGAHDGVGDDYGGNQRAEGYHDHAHYFRAVFLPEPLQIHQHEACQHGRDHLALVADHGDLSKTEIPDRDFGGGGHRETVQQLGRNQGKAQHDAQDLGGAHLFGDGPDNAHRQHVEHRFADQPQEVVNAGPELRNVRQTLGAVREEVDLTDDVAEAQNQAAADQRRNDGGEDFTQSAHDALGQRLVAGSRRLHRVLAHALDAGKSGELVVKIRHIVADDHLELARLGEGALHRGQCFDLVGFGLGRVHQNKAHPGHAVGHRPNVFLAADVLQKSLHVGLIIRHGAFLLKVFVLTGDCMPVLSACSE